MRLRCVDGMTRAACLGPIAALGLALAPIRPCLAQDRVGNAGDTTRTSRSGLATSDVGSNAAGGPEARMLVAHGLEMAIEGSGLQALARQGGTPARAGSRTAGPGGPDVAPATDGRPAALLMRHARESFEAGDRLLGQAAREAGPEQRLQAAAARYVATLRTLGDDPVNRTGAAPTGNGTGGAGAFPSATSATGFGGEGAPVPGPGGSTRAFGTADMASVALINHGVKEAIGTLKIRQMARQMGTTDSPATQALLAHARDMEASSRETIQALAGAAGGGIPDGTTRTLAQQADELIQAMLGPVGTVR